MKDEDNVQHEGNYHHQTIKHLKLVVKELQAESVQFTSQLQHEEREESQAQVVKHLQKNHCVSEAYRLRLFIITVRLLGVSGQICVSPQEQCGHVPT